MCFEKGSSKGFPFLFFHKYNAPRVSRILGRTYVTTKEGLIGASRSVLLFCAPRESPKCKHFLQQ